MRLNTVPVTDLGFPGSRTPLLAAVDTAWLVGMAWAVVVLFSILSACLLESLSSCPIFPSDFVCPFLSVSYSRFSFCLVVESFLCPGGATEY